MSFSLGHNEIMLLKLANRNGFVVGRHVVVDLAGHSFLELADPRPQADDPTSPDSWRVKYRLTEKGRDAIAIHILSGNQTDVEKEYQSWCKISPEIMA